LTMCYKLIYTHLTKKKRNTAKTHAEPTTPITNINNPQTLTKLRRRQRDTRQRHR